MQEQGTQYHLSTKPERTLARTVKGLVQRARPQSDRPGCSAGVGRRRRKRHAPYATHPYVCALQLGPSPSETKRQSLSPPSPAARHVGTNQPALPALRAAHAQLSARRRGGLGGRTDQARSAIRAEPRGSGQSDGAPPRPRTHWAPLPQQPQRPEAQPRVNVFGGRSSSGQPAGTGPAPRQPSPTPKVRITSHRCRAHPTGDVLRQSPPRVTLLPGSHPPARPRCI